jgi:hypothetical protein
LSREIFFFEKFLEKHLTFFFRLYIIIIIERIKVEQNSGPPGALSRQKGEENESH